jgi:hypothetical protein
MDLFGHQEYHHGEELTTEPIRGKTEFSKDEPLGAGIKNFNLVIVDTEVANRQGHGWFYGLKCLETAL